MNQAIRFSLLIFALFLQACSNQDDSPTINFANSESVSQSSFNGKWLVINYWAIWCKPCIEEIPELNALNKNHADIQVIGVNYDRPATEVNLEAIKKLAIEFPVSQTNLQALYQYQMPQALPTTIIISGDGMVKHELTGPQTEQSILDIIHPKKPQALTNSTN